MNSTTAYRIGLALAVASALFLLWGVAAMGIVGSGGRRLRPALLSPSWGSASAAPSSPASGRRAWPCVLAAMALAVAAITLLALILGKQQSPVSSVAEILMVNALFVALFAAAAWLFRFAARGAPPAHGRGSRSPAARRA